MTTIGLNLENIKIKNRQTILRLLNNNGAMSRKDIAKTINLTPASLTQISTEMIMQGIIIEKGACSETGKVGRKKILIDINYNFKYILVINIGMPTTSITLANLKGDVIYCHSLETDSTITAKKFLIQLAKTSKKIIKDNNLINNDILALSVTITGLVDATNGISQRAYKIWDNAINIKVILEKELNIFVVVENNIKAYAQAEILYGEYSDYNNLFFVRWFPGIGSAIVINGSLYNGKGNKVGEIGHLLVDQANELCSCGRYGCLETIASVSVILSKIKKMFIDDETPLLYELCEGNCENVLNLLIKFLNNENIILDDCILDLILMATKNVAITVINAITILSTDKVILYGNFFNNNIIFDNFIQICSDYDENYNDDYIIKSSLFNKEHYIGGVAIAFDRIFLKNGGFIS